jgi:hypothetical protein
MGLSSSFVPKVAEVFAAPAQRPPVVWLHFAECTGCSESLLRSQYPYIDELVLEVLSVEYHETIMAAAGHQAEEQLHNAVKKYDGKFICIVEGGVGTKYNGGYGKGGRSFISLKLPRTFVPRQLLLSPTAPVRLSAAFRPPPPTRVDTRVWRCHRHQTPQHSRMSAQPDQSGGHRCQLSAAGQIARAG